MSDFLRTLIVTDDSGQDLAEYALLLVLIAIVVIAALGPLSTQIKAGFDKVTTALGGGS